MFNLLDSHTVIVKKQASRIVSSGFVVTDNVEGLCNGKNESIRVDQNIL
jgi:hypothetical protein